MGSKTRKQMVPGHCQKQIIGYAWTRTSGFGSRQLAELVLLLCLVLGLTGPTLAADPGRVVVPLLDSPVRGPMDAPVTMIEFVDFQ